MSDRPPALYERLSLLALALVNLGGAVPYGITEITTAIDAQPNATEWVLSAAFGVAALASIVGAIRLHSIVAEVAFVSGGLWLMTGTYLALFDQLDPGARLGMSLIFDGIAIGCFALWQRLRWALA